ncbi:hypothetical protein BR93DRAFT_882374 [Coniochaeta sp. PMI_546]|nr:hypothetical protein BR93DRAFT_882374 [Coniochaeta sp. PMI_546]
MSTRKRPRQSEPVEQAADNKAECPFTAVVVDPKEKEQKNKKRRRTAGSEEEHTKISVQPSPFSPSGTFKTHATMDVHYKVEPAKRWTDMTRYNSFVLNNTKYFSEGFIFVANDASIERQKNLANAEGKKPPPLERSADDWVARILEIRASDEHHVYARVFWMYWPDELPKNTRDGNKLVKGRQPYHGSRELIASNHMDIINVVSVTSQAAVNHWLEENDAEIQENLYWRQALDIRTFELSSLLPICKCNRPGNPDEVLIGCSTPECNKWMHKPCIKHDALMRTYKELGTDKPHVSPESKDKPPVKEEVQRPLSPTETGAAGLAQDSIGVVSSGTKDNVDVSGSNDDAPATGKKTAETEKSGSETPVPGSARRVGRPKKHAEVNGDAKPSDKPYEGLFDVEIRVDINPPQLLFTDLRENVKDGDKEWSEPIMCLCCGNQCI